MKILEIKNLCKSFGKTSVLKDVNFSMEEGEVVSVIGASGSGKTTLLRCINFLERADKGQILLDGEVLFDGESEKRSSAKELRKKQRNFGLVFQDFNLFPQYNVIDNVMLAPKLLAKERPDFKSRKKEIYGEIEQTARELLERVGLSEKLSNYPCELSGGQKQRISIARVFLKNPPILILDEATSALDNESERIVQRSLEKLAVGRTVFTIAHRLTTIRNADVILVLTEDGIEEQGSHEELMKQNGLYSDLYQMYQDL